MTGLLALCCPGYDHKGESFQNTIGLDVIRCDETSDIIHHCQTWSKG